MRTKLILFLIIVSVLIVSFSIGQENPQWKGKIEYENGIKVIKNPKLALYGEIKFVLEEDLSIGSTDDENSTFFKSVLIAVDSKGCILVLDSANCRILKFNNKGKFLYSFGRKGQGPGEFIRPTELILDQNDNVYVKETRKLHKFNRAGEYEKTIPLDRNYRSIGITKGGTIFAFAHTSSQAGLSDDVYLLASSGETLKTIASFSKPSSDYSSKIRFTPAVILPKLYLCPLDKDGAVYSHSSRYRLYVTNSLGKVNFIFEKNEQPNLITPIEKEQLIISLIMSFNKKGEQITRREAENAYNFTKSWPFFDSLLKDDKNNIYVRKRELDRSNPKDYLYIFDLFNKEGYCLYRVKISFMPKIIKNGYVYRIQPDEDGYLFIKRYKIKNWGQIKTGVSN